MDGRTAAADGPASVDCNPWDPGQITVREDQRQLVEPGCAPGGDSMEAAEGLGPQRRGGVFEDFEVGLPGALPQQPSGLGLEYGLQPGRAPGGGVEVAGQPRAVGLQPRQQVEA